MPVSLSCTVAQTRPTRREAEGIHRDDHGRLHLLHQSPHRLGGLHPVVPSTPVRCTATGRNPAKCFGMAAIRCRVMRTLSAASGPTASGVMDRLPSPTTSAAPSGGSSDLSWLPTARTARSKKIGLALPEGGQVNGQVAAPGFAQGLLAPLIQNVHPGHRIALLLALDGLDPRQTRSPLRRLLPQFPGLQRQIRAFYKTKAPLPDTKSCGCGPRFCIPRHNIQKVNGNCKKSFAF